MAEFVYQDPFPLSKDETQYRLLTKEFVSEGAFEGSKILKIAPEGLQTLAREAMGSAVRTCSQMAPCIISMPRLIKPANSANGFKSPKKLPV